MEVKRITPIPLTNDEGKKYAVIAAESELKKKAAEVKYLGGGSFGKAFKVTFEDNTKAVIKFLRAKDMLKKEAYDLKLLGESTPVKMPKVLFVREADDKIPVDCYGMEMLEGRNACMDVSFFLTSRKKRMEFAENVTSALHSIHSHKSDRFGDTLNPVYENWIDCYKPFAEAVLREAQVLYNKGELSGKIMDTMNAAWEKFDVIFSEPVTEACLIHGDLNIANIMIDKKGNLAGFIDPLNSMYADREYDLFQFYNLTGKHFFLGETYRKKYGESRHCDDKLAFYGLWNEVFCLIKSGVLVGFIMNPLVKNMNRRIKNL